MTNQKDIIGIAKDLNEWYDTEAKDDEVGDIYSK